MSKMRTTKNYVVRCLYGIMCTGVYVMEGCRRKFSQMCDGPKYDVIFGRLAHGLRKARTRGRKQT